MRSTLLCAALFAFALPLFGSGSDDPALIRGDAYYRAMDNAKALQEYEVALKLDSTDFNALARLVRIYNDLGRLELRSHHGGEEYHEKSITYADELLKYHPDRAETYFWLALSYGSLARYKGISEKVRLGKVAREYAEKAVSMDSTFSMSYVVLGIFYREAARLSWLEKILVRAVFGANFQGTYAESEQMFRRAIDLDEGNIFAHYELAITYRAMGLREKALQELRIASQLPVVGLREEAQRQDAAARLARWSAAPTPSQ